MTSGRISQRATWAAGQPISDLMAKALAHPELISLAAGFVDNETLPVEMTAAAVDAVLSDPLRARAALQYGTTPGYRPLREAVLAQLVAADGPGTASSAIDADQVVVTAGSNQMLHLVADTLFNPGDIVLCAAPTYFVYLGLLQNLGVRSVGVAADSDGMIPDSLDEALRRIEREGELHRVKAIYVVTYYDNPSGATLAAERRPQIVELAQRWSRQTKIHIIEDAAYRELRLDGDDTPSLRAFDESGDTVIFTQTFSKSYSPGVRIGWGILPTGLVEPICNQKSNLDFGSPNFSQHLMAEMLRQGKFPAHVAKLRHTYREKRDAMLAAADKYLTPIPGVEWVRPHGGMFVWLKVPETIATGLRTELFDQAIAEGMIYVPGEFSYPSEGVAVPQNMIRLTYGVQSPARIDAGMAALGRALQHCLTTHAATIESR